MKIMYIHGFGSVYDEANNPKLMQLNTIGEVCGYSYDYTALPANNVDQMIDFAIDNKVDVVVGCSLGGWYAAVVAHQLGVASVLINPATRPEISLQQYVGAGVDWYGKSYHLESSTVDAYDYHKLNAIPDNILLLLDDGDEVIDANQTIKYFNQGQGRSIASNNVHVFDGGSHRFDHMDQALPLIQAHYENLVQVGYLDE